MFGLPAAVVPGFLEFVTLIAVEIRVTADASEAGFPAESFQAYAVAPTVPKSPSVPLLFRGSF
jgi:hypothetical protein